jgi:hypothetical protein
MRAKKKKKKKLCRRTQRRSLATELRPVRPPMRAFPAPWATRATVADACHATPAIGAAAIKTATATTTTATITRKTISKK